MGEFRDRVQEEYGIVVKSTTVRNPQANAVIERMHQTLGNILRTFDLKNLRGRDPWKDVIATALFAVRATVHTTLQATPMQLVYGRDAILNVKHTADWDEIKQRKQKLINENNKRENSKRIEHRYEVGQRILIKRDSNQGKYEPLHDGPFTITHVNDNGTVRYQDGATNDVINIRQIHPYQQ